MCSFYKFSLVQTAFDRAVTAIGPIDQLFVPYLRNATTGLYENEGRRLNPRFWQLGQPNMEDCVGCQRASCITIHCSLAYPFLCRFARRPLLRLRGLCGQTYLDTLYYPANREGENHIFKLCSWEAVKNKIKIFTVDIKKLKIFQKCLLKYFMNWKRSFFL